MTKLAISIRAELPMLLSTGTIRRKFGLSRFVMTLWQQKKLIVPIYTPGGHRRFLRDEVVALFEERFATGKKRHVPRGNPLC